MVFSSGAKRLGDQLRLLTIIDRILLGLMVVVLLGGFIYGIHGLLTIERYEITRIPHNNTVYECKHNLNTGDMSCVDINDPDVGFGQIK